QTPAREMQPRVAVVHAMDLERGHEEHRGDRCRPAGARLDRGGARCYSPRPMSFFRLLLVAVVLTVLAAAHARADEATTTTPPSTAAPEAAAGAPVKQETVVNGTPPRLLGKWLAVSFIQAGNGRFTTLHGLW